MELKILRDKCLIFNQFMVENGGLPPQLAEVYEESNKLIENAYVNKDSKALKAMNQDIDNQVLKHMPFKMANDLKQLFYEKLQLDFDVVDRAYTKALGRILKKGKITNDNEYELLLNRVDEIYEDRSRAEEVQRLNLLLSEYHKFR